VPDAPGYVVCATPRSGMALLCDALEGTGAAAPPAARLMWSDVDPLLTRHGALWLERYGRELRRRRRGPALAM
jgi:LPS sulfotransferase NodH